MAERSQRPKSPGFKTAKLFKEKALGFGSFGKVCVAQYDELPCAAKIIHETLVLPSTYKVTPQEKRKTPVSRFERECEFLSQLRHPNIVQCLGVCRDTTSGLLVLLMELMQENLTEYVKRSEQPILYHIQVNICHDITQALSFLHSNDIVHRDLSSNNVLLDRYTNAKVSDFGMAKFTDGTCTECPGADVYMPPESVNPNPHYTEKLDCFSFGVITLQILTRKEPKPEDRRKKIVVKDEEYEKAVEEIVRRRQHLSEVPCDHPLLPIIINCLKDKDDERPSARELCNVLAELKSTALYKQYEAIYTSEILTLRERNLEQDRALQEMKEENERLQAQLRGTGTGQAREKQGRERRPQGNNNWPRLWCCSSSWMNWLIILSIPVVIIAYMWMPPSPGINTPLSAPRAVISNWKYDKRLWGSYRSNVYFGMRPRIPKSLLSGMMWYVYGRSSGIRHTCEDDQLPIFGWLKHDGVSFGQQEIVDNGTTLSTNFVTTPNGWTARIRADPDPQISSRVLVSFFFYIYNEGSGTIAFTTSNSDNKGMKIHGHTPELKEFQMWFDERFVSNSAIYNYTATTMKFSANWMPNYVQHIMKYDWLEKRKNWPAIIQLPGDIKDPKELEFKPNTVVYQITTYLPFEIDMLFEVGGVHTTGEDNFTNTFNARMVQFDQKFQKVFQLESKGFNESEVSFAKVALSNLLGSISYFYGQSIVKSKDSPDILNYWQAPLYTAIPSRTSFPRGFLWNEGFHQLLVVHWDTSTVKDVIAHWLDLMNHEGWIPREQILGEEARSKVPAEFIVQVNDHANPPTFFLTLEALIESETRPDFVFLRRIFPRLKKWFEWFSTTQAGEMAYTYRWRGRNETTDLELNPKTMASGFDDFPRASHPTSHEYHVDLRCWMTLASGVMAKIAQLLREDSHLYWLNYEILSDQDLLDRLHWNGITKTYSDYGLHTSFVKLQKFKVENKSSIERRVTNKDPTTRFVDSFGYANLFPFFFKLVSPSSEQLGFILSMLGNESILWTNYGLRSLSKQDAFYNKFNNEYEKPYWRGAIWINMNYLACRALYHYGNIEGPYRLKAEKLYNQLRSNLISNMYREFDETGYIWERYDDEIGYGQGTRPFTGWSSLIVLIMAEKY